jgi:lipopolysaccharide/colanic/teichoic acid biosynthesis glycosyltransferase
MVRSKVADVDSKRALDLVVGSFALLVSVPVLLGVALGMRLTGDHGPFLYRAQRVGEGGRRITVLKVRTMLEGSRGSGLTARGDPRVTRLGRLLRRYRIDELPQLINVVRGEMSLVGPRPEDPRFVDLSDPHHRRVFMARPGITGLAQLRYRDEALLLTGPDFERRYREEILPAKLLLDAEYLEMRSMWVDLRILVQTISAVLR